MTSGSRRPARRLLFEFRAEAGTGDEEELAGERETTPRGAEGGERVSPARRGRWSENEVCDRGAARRLGDRVSLTFVAQRLIH
jgi:hypothetical protein